jgi:hypothetical protein
VALLAVAASSVSVNGDDVTSPPPTDAATVSDPAPLISAPPDTEPTTTVPTTQTPTTVSPTTVSPTTVSPTTVLPATVPPTTVVPATTVVATTVAVASSPPVPLPTMVEVVDQSGTLIAQMPQTFQTNVLGVTLNGVQMHHVSGADDMQRYLAGDFTAFGATVLAGPTALVGTPSDLLVQFDPSVACTLTDGEVDLPTPQGAVTVLSYDLCAGDNAMVLMAVQMDELHQVVLVSVQGPGPSIGPMRDLAFAILASVRQA